ncbi:MAG TPA: septum formation initiator family protein [bacterium]|nr:septum formation initiator family protein [bacterium]
MSLAATRARARAHPRPPRRVVVLLIAGVAALYLFGAGFLEWYALNREVARLTAVRRSLREQNAVLREEMRLLQTPAYIEKLAREQLGLVRPGEVAILILRTPAPAPPPPPGRIERDSRSLPARLWQALRRRLR